MAKNLACHVAGCRTSIIATTTEGIMDEVVRHAKHDRPEVNLDEETIATLRASIREA